MECEHKHEHIMRTDEKLHRFLQESRTIKTKVQVRTLLMIRGFKDKKEKQKVICFGTV